MDDAASNADRHRLSSVTGAQLLHNVLDMHLHRLFSYEQLLRDVPVPVSPADLIEHLYFALGQRFVAKVLGQARRNLCRNTLFASMYLSDYLNQLLRGRVF